jgi:hypothetical protein
VATRKKLTEAATTPARSATKKKARKASAARGKTKNGKPGRKSYFDGVDVEAICARIAEGVRPQVAGAEHGVSPTTFDRWLAEGRAGKSPELTEFGEKVARARLIGEGRLVDRVRRGDGKAISFGAGKAALELLSRTVKAYQPKIKVGIEEELRKFLDVARRVLPSDLFETLLRELAALDDQDED